MKYNFDGQVITINVNLPKVASKLYYIVQSLQSKFFISLYDALHGSHYQLISEMSRPGSGTVHASSNVAASHLLGNYLT